MNIFLFLVLPILVFLATAVVMIRARARLPWQAVTYTLITLALLALGLPLVSLFGIMSIPFLIGSGVLVLASISLFAGIVEFTVLPLLGQFRLGAIARITYYEALLQPFTLIVICAGFAAIGIAAGLEYFTYNEDFKMYRDVSTSFVFLFSLPIMIFASTKVIDEEIENRTMLTLMSKPVSRWQVILGKYLGILLLMLVVVISLGIAAGVAGYLRYYDDMLQDYMVSNPQQRIALDFLNYKAFLALLPGLTLTFLQLATLAAISVALSTRWGLAVNVTVVVIVYIAANIAGFAQSALDLPAPLAALATGLSYILPGLGLLDLNQRLIFGNFIFGKNDWLSPMSFPTYGVIWQYVGLAAVYSLFYIGAALSLGMALFRSRELS